VPRVAAAIPSTPGSSGAPLMTSHPRQPHDSGGGLDRVGAVVVETAALAANEPGVFGIG
jgi:hypothetical protein